MENIACKIYDFDIDKYYDGIILNNRLYLLDKYGQPLEIKDSNCRVRYDEMQTFFIDEEDFKKVGEDKKRYKWGYFRCRNGEIVIPPIYDEAFPFEDGLACIKLDDNFGFIDHLGNEKIEPIYDYIGICFRGGLCPAKKEGKVGFIDKKERERIEFKYEFATEFLVSEIAEGRERLYAIVKEDERFGIIDSKGNYIIEPIYDELRQVFFEDLLIAKLDGKYGVLKVKYNKELNREIGVYIAEHIFDDFGSMIEVDYFKKERYFYTMKIENSVCIINRKLELIFGENNKDYVPYKGHKIKVSEDMFLENSPFRYRKFKG